MILSEEEVGDLLDAGIDAADDGDTVDELLTFGVESSSDEAGENDADEVDDDDGDDKADEVQDVEAADLNGVPPTCEGVLAS